MKSRPSRRRFTHIGLTGNPRDSQVMEAVALLAAHLQGAGHTVYLSRNLPREAAPRGAHRVTEKELGEKAGLVVAVGGDGTMLYAARRIARYKVPLLGINRGRLGFLADVAQEHMLARLDEVLAGRFVTERRMLLETTLVRGRRIQARAIALNDVVVKRQDTGRMLEYQTFVGGRYVNTHLGDGFIVATPTGSTAYALSCGGPIVEPGLEAMVLAPICPHTLSDRPIVVPADRVAELRLREGESDRAEVTCDGEVVGNLGPGDCVRIRVARQRLELVHPESYDYYAILRSKLRWGRDTGEPGNGAGPGSKPVGPC